MIRSASTAVLAAALLFAPARAADEVAEDATTISHSETQIDFDVHHAMYALRQLRKKDCLAEADLAVRARALQDGGKAVSELEYLLGLPHSIGTPADYERIEELRERIDNVNLLMNKVVQLPACAPAAN